MRFDSFYMWWRHPHQLLVDQNLTYKTCHLLSHVISGNALVLKNKIEEWNEVHFILCKRYYLCLHGWIDLCMHITYVLLMYVYYSCKYAILLNFNDKILSCWSNSWLNCGKNSHEMEPGTKAKHMFLDTE